ncbi:glycosyltransferase family 4 protein [Hymenobacter lucidus]|uniref:Glycosyltransferase family 4 protein n=1 Tax=Hymenobacter lucidus TaxID=2880930 RepID=A0ABS8ATW5_9BACT|nr:glycosyltransferase family 4 protein [Hymenobacter lucidus]MCB2408497.1 glycosyltransferase family 4 protein [Hymenobacter lucidus]
MKKPLILVVDNSRAVTGALNAMRHATGPLREQFAFEYVIPTGSTARSVLEQDGYPVHELPFVEISRRKADLLRYVPMLLLNGWRLYRLAKRQGASLLHLNDFYNLTGYVAKALSLGRIRVITHVRFLPQSLVQPLARTWKWLGETYADQVVCVSEAVRRYFGPSGKVQVVFDPLPGQERHPVPAVPASRPDGSVRLLYLSNYIQGKGQDMAVQAFQQAYAQNNRLRLTFVGGDMGLEKNREFRQQLEAAVQTAGLASAVSFQGFATDVEQAIKEADILLNFSESESFSLTCLDALYFGTPLIASDCGGPAELFENGVSGLLVPNRDVPAMTEAINKLATDPNLRQRFAAAGREFVRYKFRAAATFQQLGAVYTQVLARQ